MRFGIDLSYFRGLFFGITIFTIMMAMFNHFNKKGYFLVELPLFVIGVVSITLFILFQILYKRKERKLRVVDLTKETIIVDIKAKEGEEIKGFDYVKENKIGEIKQDTEKVENKWREMFEKYKKEKQNGG